MMSGGSISSSGLIYDPPSLAMKALKWIAIGLGGLIVVIVACVAWLLTSENGARWLVRTASNILGPALEVGGVEGAIAHGLTLTDLRYHDPTGGLDVSAERIAVDLALADLVRRVVHVRSAQLAGVNVMLREPSTPPPEEPVEPFSLEPPIDVVIDSLIVERAEVRREAAAVFELTRGTLRGQWTATGIGVEQLELQSPQGEVQFAGTARQQQAFLGEGAGSFHWRVGARTFAGDVAARASGGETQLDVELTQPLPAKLRAFLGQARELPWRFTLTTPRFDPSEGLIAETNLKSLALELQGAGALDRGEIDGRVDIDDQALVIRSLRFARDKQTVTLDGDLALNERAGELTAHATLDLAKTPLSANGAATWRDVVIPAAWAGQELHTHGKLDLSGDASRFQAAGSVSIGPPNYIASIELALEGSPDLLQLRQFDIVQAKGRLAAKGAVHLKPQIAWDISAVARTFNPGDFLAGWPGRLNFDLASTGRVTQEGPTGTLRLNKLAGELRGRKITGGADLSLTPQLVPSGTLSLITGETQLHFNGRPGAQTDATVSLSVASLGDWVTGAAGRANAAFAVRGRWPHWAVKGGASGEQVTLAGVGMDAFELTANVDDLRNPAGRAAIELRKLSAAGFEFATVEAHASGNPAGHQIEVHGAGSPLALDVVLQGAQKKRGWSGDLQQLVFDVKDVSRLTLREPAHLTATGGAFELSQACLTDAAIELCARGSMGPGGKMQATYSIANLPLALADVFAAESGMAFDGIVAGHGDIRRTTQGELFGDAVLESPEGKISPKVAAVEGEEPDEPEGVLSWADVRIAAHLAGADANGSLTAKFAESGSLEGEATLRGLRQATPQISGRIAAHLPDLAPFAVFVPQVANLRGRADAEFTIGGTLASPQLAGQLQASELAGDLPLLGLHLKDGVVSAHPSDREILLEGGVDSGEGRVEFSGTVNPAAGFSATLNIKGDRLLAADIPAARVIVAPDLKLVRTSTGMNLSGSVAIPEAKVNLQALARDSAQVRKPSPDVVVIDDATRRDKLQAAPVFAAITVVVGDKVEIAGFGLEAQVRGRLDVRERPGEPTRGSGELRIEGKYQAYGQNLTINEGRLLFASTPINNPSLNFLATRAIEDEDVTVGFRVRGTAKAPILTVFSNPSMSETNALSYLLTGKPLDELRDGEGGDAVQAATRSLGSMASGRLAQNLGQRLGVDEVAVTNENMLGGSALTLGEYLSPRLFLSYGFGLFTPGDVITLRYTLSDAFNVKVQRSPDDTRAGIEYRVER